MLNPVRRALLVLAICSFGLGTGEYAVLGVLPEIANDLDVSVSQAGHLVSAYALGVVIGAPVLAAISVRFPRKGLLIVLVLGLALGNVLSAVMTNFYGLVGMRFLAGLPHGAFFGLASVQAAKLVPVHRRSQAIAIVFAGLTVSNVVGVPLTTFIGQNTSWSVVFLLVAGVELVGVLGMLAAVPRSAPNPDEAPSLATELRVFKNEQIWLALGVAMIGCGAIFATFSYIAPMMTEVAGYAPASITPLLVIFGLGMTFGNLVGARLSDRYDVSKVIYCVMAAQVIVAAVFYFASSNKIAAAVMIFLFPFCNTMAFPALQNRIISMAGGAPNLAAASMHAAFNIANSLGAWLGGMTIAAGWGYNSPNLVAVGLGLIAAVVAVYASKINPSMVRRSRPNLYSVPPPSNGPRARATTAGPADAPAQTTLQLALQRARQKAEAPATPATGPLTWLPTGEATAPGTAPDLVTASAATGPITMASGAPGPAPAPAPATPATGPLPTAPRIASPAATVRTPATGPLTTIRTPAAPATGPITTGPITTGPRAASPAATGRTPATPATAPIPMPSATGPLAPDSRVASPATAPLTPDTGVASPATGTFATGPAISSPATNPLLLSSLAMALGDDEAPTWGPQHTETNQQQVQPAAADRETDPETDPLLISELVSALSAAALSPGWATQHGETGAQERQPGAARADEPYPRPRPGTPRSDKPITTRPGEAWPHQVRPR